MNQLELKIVHEMAAIPAASWDALLRPDDNPFPCTIEDRVMKPGWANHPPADPKTWAGKRNL